MMEIQQEEVKDNHNEAQELLFATAGNNLGELEENDTNYFSSPKFDSVIDRYYTRLYKPVTPRMISTLMGKDCDAENADSQCLDQYYFIHTNKLMLFGITSKHEAIVKN